MDSSSVMMIQPVEVAEPRRGLVAFLSVATISVWSFTAVAMAQAVAI